MDDYLKKNVKAFESWAKSSDKSIVEAYSDDPNDTMFTLRTIYGLRCSKCGNGVTGPNLKFCGFEPGVKCLYCQRI